MTKPNSVAAQTMCEAVNELRDHQVNTAYLGGKDLPARLLKQAKLVERMETAIREVAFVLSLPDMATVRDEPWAQRVLKLRSELPSGVGAA